MSKILKLTVSSATPLRHGLDYVWSAILDLTREGSTFTFGDIKGVCDQGRIGRVRLDLTKLEKAGFLERLPAERSKGARPYRLLIRQSDTPRLRTGGESGSDAGLRIQHMWNVMRRARNGFTSADLAIDASTDTVKVSYPYAVQYCRLLEQAGMLKRQAAPENGTGRHIYVLLGSANTGPKAPRRYKATLVFDENRGRVVGPVVAEEVEP
jgi:hypothetical protein